MDEAHANNDLFYVIHSSDQEELAELSDLLESGVEHHAIAETLELQEEVEALACHDETGELEEADPPPYFELFPAGAAIC